MLTMCAQYSSRHGAIGEADAAAADGAIAGSMANQVTSCSDGCSLQVQSNAGWKKLISHSAKWTGTAAGYQRSSWSVRPAGTCVFGYKDLQQAFFLPPH